MFWVRHIQFTVELSRSSLFFLPGKFLKWSFLFWTQLTPQGDEGFVQTISGVVVSNELPKLCSGIYLYVILRALRIIQNQIRDLHCKYWYAAKCFRTSSPKIICCVLENKTKRNMFPQGWSQVTKLRLLNEEYSHDSVFLSLVWFNSL